MVTTEETFDAIAMANKMYLTAYEERWIVRYYLQLDSHRNLSVKDLAWALQIYLPEEFEHCVIQSREYFINQGELKLTS